MQRQTATQSALSGAFGGFCLVGVAHPFDTIKVKLQNGNITSNSTFVQAAKHVLKADGFWGFYRGVKPVFVGTPVVLALNLWAYNQAQRLVSGDYQSFQSIQQLSLLQVGLAGGLASLPTSLLVAPAELVKVRLQVETSTKSSSTWSIIKDVVKTGQATRGLGCTFARDVLGSFFYFLTYESFKRASSKDNGATPNPFVVLFGGGIAGMVNWTIAMPFDNLKTRLQANPASTLSSIITSINKEGISHYFTGLRPTLIRAFPASMAFFGGVEVSLWAMR